MHMLLQYVSIYIYIHNIHFHIYVPLETYEIRFRHKFRTTLNIVWNPWHQYWTHGGKTCKKSLRQGQGPKQKKHWDIFSISNNQSFCIVWYSIMFHYIIAYNKFSVVLWYCSIWHSMIGYCMMFIFLLLSLHVYIYILLLFDLICSNITSYDITFYLSILFQDNNIIWYYIISILFYYT